MSDMAAMDGVAHGPRVLMLDDNVFFLELVGDMLRNLGAAEVLTETEGGRALAHVETEKPDMVICDLGMPGMDGIEFLRHLAGQEYSGGVVVLSGLDKAVLKSAENLARSHGLNLLGVQQKPLEEDALAAIIARLGQSRPQRGGKAVPEVEMLAPEELREGLEAGRVEVFFQPKVSVRGRHVLGAECLARWRHPERGLLTPDAFISVAEQHGLIDALALAVFRNAVAQLGQWRKQGQQISVAINLSMDNLNRLDLPDVFEKIAHEAGVETGAIILEMTESRLMDNYTLSLDILTRLRLKGFGLSIDDFGTAYSTMENLKQLPFTELKIDRAFVNGASRDRMERAILDSSVRLGKALKLNLVAEGVETQEDWELVARCGCNEVQGYFIAPPMPAHEWMDWVARWESTPERRRKHADAMFDEDAASGKARILVVDDDEFMREMFDETLAENYQLAFAENGADALMLAQTEHPDLILMDVDMPAMDGYETCRRLKEMEGLADVPVVFVSGMDEGDDRVRGYEAGGEDYLIKPFDPLDLEVRVAHLLKVVSDRSSLKAMANYATTTAMTAMTSMSELGALLETLKHFNACADYPALARAMLSGLAGYGLQGVAQVRSQEGVLTLNPQGEASALEISVIEHMTGMERITQFKNRMCITYEHVSMLVNDMPVDDSERCGRLRDHLAMLVEGAEVRVRGLMAGLESQRRGEAIERASGRITAALKEIDQAQRQSRMDTAVAVSVFMDKMESALLSVALTEAQDVYLSDIVREGIDDIIRTQSAEVDMQNKLTGVIQELRSMSGAN